MNPSDLPASARTTETLSDGSVLIRDPLAASAPTVTRYRVTTHGDLIPESLWTSRQEAAPIVVLYAEVASLLTALAESEAGRRRLAEALDREEDTSARLSGQYQEAKAALAEAEKERDRLLEGWIISDEAVYIRKSDVLTAIANGTGTVDGATLWERIGALRALMPRVADSADAQLKTRQQTVASRDANSDRGD